MTHPRDGGKGRMATKRHKEHKKKTKAENRNRVQKSGALLAAF
jgi:hypothetical protein